MIPNKIPNKNSRSPNVGGFRFGSRLFMALNSVTFPKIIQPAAYSQQAPFALSSFFLLRPHLRPPRPLRRRNSLSACC